MSPSPPATTAPADRKALRWVYGVPLVLLNLAMAGSCFYALATEPRGPWDEDALTGIEAMAFTTLALGVLPLALTALALRRRVLSPWWLAPPMALALLALARWIHVTQQYP